MADDAERYEDNTKRVMVDLETLGKQPGSAIVSIGAVAFSNGELGDEFYWEVDPKSCERKGMGIEAGTLEWWLEQSDDAKEALTGGEDINDVVSKFTSFYRLHDFDEIWANSPSFDCDFLTHAYIATDKVPKKPWKYYDERDVRTIRSLPCAVTVEMDGEKHDALDDARNQAREVSETLQRLHAYDRMDPDE